MRVTFEQVNCGDQLPEVKREIIQDKIDRNAAASLDFNPVHISSEWCRAVKHTFPRFFTDSPVAHGMHTMSFLATVITNWCYPDGWIKYMESKFTRPVKPGDILTCGGLVTEKHSLGERRNFVTVELYADNQRGERIMVGSAKVDLPD